MSARDALIARARREQLTRPGEPFNATTRIQRLVDVIAALATALESTTTPPVARPKERVTP